MIQNLLKVVEDYIGCDDQPLTIGMFKAMLMDAQSKQQESSNFSVIGQHITEPEQVDKDSHLLGGVPKDDKAPACLDGKGDATIKPEDTKAGEWYVVKDSVRWKMLNPSAKPPKKKY